jgi:hypothetical protein
LKRVSKEEEMPGQKTTRLFVMEKDTKNTRKFTEVPADGEAPILGTVYLQKWFVRDAKAVRIDVTLSEE